MKTGAVFLSFAVTCLAAASLAEPALPKGWIAGRPGLQEAGKEAPGGEDAAPQVVEVRRPRPASRAKVIDVDALPVISIGKRRPVDETPAALPEGSAADVVVLKAGGARRLNVAGFAAGTLIVGRVRTFFGAAGVGGLPNVCGDGAKGKPIARVIYRAIRRADADKEGGLEFVLGRGFLETATCRVAIEERWSVRPARMAGGLLLGFRTRCDACSEEPRDALHVLTPQLTSIFDEVVPLEHHTLSLDKGSSGIVKGFAGVSSSMSAKLPEWGDFSDRACPKGTDTCGQSLRVEVSRAENEPKATVTVLPNIAEP